MLRDPPGCRRTAAMAIQQMMNAVPRQTAGADALDLAHRVDHWTVFKGLLPFVWPEGRPDLRLRVALAVAVLVLAKVVTISVPIFFKEATDWLTAHAPQQGAARIGQGLGLGATGLIIAY